MDEQTKINKAYIEAFNQGYILSKELNLKPDILEGLNAGQYRVQAMKEGMQAHQKEIELEKNKSQEIEIIPPLDLDSINEPYIGLDIDEKSKDKDIDMEL